MKKIKYSKRSVLVVIGIILIGIGMSTPGLWPFQLPCCAIGGILIRPT